jgi:hypothetical protein
VNPRRDGTGKIPGNRASGIISAEGCLAGSTVVSQREDWAREESGQSHGKLSWSAQRGEGLSFHNKRLVNANPV